MTTQHKLIDLSCVQSRPLAERRSRCRIEDILIAPESPPPLCPPEIKAQIQTCAASIRAGLRQRSAIILMYGAHLIKNGGAAILRKFMEHGWVTHLATNGAGAIHDWEFAFLGRSTESVKENVATGTFGAWDETGRMIHLALLVAGLRAEGFGQAVGQLITEDGITLPPADYLIKALISEPAHPLAPARAELLQAILKHVLPVGRQRVQHPWKQTSVLAGAFQWSIPLTVHPGIGYDIITVHPMFNGAVIGRAATVDFQKFASAVEGLDDGVVLSIGSAIMAPQVFEKSLSCVNNLRLQAQRPVVKGHSFFVVDLQEGGHWDWTTGEPPMDNPAYYLRFCKSFSRMGGAMHYVCCDNVAFLHNLYAELLRLENTG